MVRPLKVDAGAEGAIRTVFIDFKATVESMSLFGSHWWLAEWGLVG